MTTCKVIGGVKIPANTALYGRVGAGAYQKIAIPGGVYYISDDGGSDDLIDVLATLATAALSSTVTITLVTTGGLRLVRMTNAGASNITIRTTDPAVTDPDEGQVIFDLFRWSGTSTTLAPAAAKIGTKTHAGGLYPTVYTLEDLRSSSPRAGQSVSDDGNARTVYLSTIRSAELTLRVIEAYDRQASAAWTDYHYLRDWMEEHAGKGLPFRYYPDATVTDPYDDDAEHFGYHTYKLKQGSLGWRPDPPFNPWYSAWDHTFDCYDLTSY